MATQHEQEIVTRLNAMSEPFFEAMHREVLSVDLEKSECSIDFDLGVQYCHSGDVVQGGFVSAMLDAVTTHAVFAVAQDVTMVATLEFKVSFLEVSKMGKFLAVGRVDKITKSIAFLSGELYSPEGVLTASISSTSKIRRQR